MYLLLIKNVVCSSQNSHNKKESFANNNFYSSTFRIFCCASPLDERGVGYSFIHIGVFHSIQGFKSLMNIYNTFFCEARFS
jgi:hypothetical protein